MNGMKEAISAIVLVPLDIGMSWVGHVSMTVNLNPFDLKMISFIVMSSQIMVQIALIRLLDAPQFGTSSIPMDHAYQPALSHTEIDGMMNHISAIPLALVNTMTIWEKRV
jgi:hypothetical protein